MDTSEALAFKFLQSRGLSDAIYEPDGNVPPDFCCGGIAIEVRRLNQHDKTGKGLEETSIPLVMKCENLLKGLGPADGVSWFVMFRFRRPIEAWPVLRPKIEWAILEATYGDTAAGGRVRVSESLSLGVARASRPLGTRYVLGGYTDHDSGGFIASEIIKNVNLVVAEKTKKIEPYRRKYLEWWLVLIDHIGHASLDSQEISVLREHIAVPPEWSKVLLINPRSPEMAVEI